MSTPERDTPRPPTRLGRWRWLLIPSLVLTLLVIGLIAGVAMKGREFHRGLPPVPPTLVSVVGALPEAEQTEIRRTVRRLFSSENREQRRAASERNRTEPIALLEADSFDRAAAEAILTRQRDRLAETYTGIVALLLDRVEAMSPEDRRAFAAEIGFSATIFKVGCCLCGKTQQTN